MSSSIITLRLNADELEILDRCRNSRELGELTRSEFFRMLLHREESRRKKSGPPRPAEYSGEWRVGRPRKVQLQEKL